MHFFKLLPTIDQPGTKSNVYPWLGCLSHIWFNQGLFRYKIRPKSKILKIVHFLVSGPQIHFGDPDSGNCATATNPIAMFRVHMGLNYAVWINWIGYHAARQSQLMYTFLITWKSHFFSFSWKNTFSSARNPVQCLHIGWPGLSRDYDQRF
jgi:hypothetical protein